MTGIVSGALPAQFLSEPVNFSGAVASVSSGERDSSAGRENEGEGPSRMTVVSAPRNAVAAARRRAQQADDFFTHSQPSTSV